MTSKVDRKKFTLRLPPSLQAQLEEAALENDRSLNAEIVSRLRASLVQWVR